MYIALGTVINERLDFYQKCIDALREEPVDVVISCGESVDVEAFGTLPEHVRVYASVDQPEVLAKANVFLTHCGMNSVSESLYMATPMVLYPQTNEQRAVARRVRRLAPGWSCRRIQQSASGRQSGRFSARRLTQKPRRTAQAIFEAAAARRKRRILSKAHRIYSEFLCRSWQINILFWEQGNLEKTDF